MSVRERRFKLAALVGVPVLAALAGMWLQQISSSRSADAKVTATAIASSSLIPEGPGGRVALTEFVVRMDRSDSGERHGWADGHFAGRPIRVPGVLNALPVTGAAGERGFKGSLAWYRTSFHTDHLGAYAISFQSANFLARVWIDGHRLGSHEGTYLPFEFRHTLRPGLHTLVVRLDWRDPIAQSAAGFHRTWFNFGGINGEVSVRAITSSTLEHPELQTRLQPDSPTTDLAVVRLGIDTCNYGPSRSLSPVATLQRGDTTIPVSFPSVVMRSGQCKRLSARARIEHPALWSPNAPNLYQLTIAIDGESSYSAAIGLRQLTWGDGVLYLNGTRLTLHGASIPEDARGRGDALSPHDQQTLVDELKAIGANATRSQHPLDSALLERLDRAGILVWQGVGPVDPAGGWSAQTPPLRQLARERVQQTVMAERLHPSIIAWNLTNELAGDNGHPGGQAAYVTDMARWLHQNDPTRMVAVDIWGDHPPRDPGPLFAHVDAVSETDYSGWYDEPNSSSRVLRNLVARRLRLMHRTFPSKVQIISEFGAEANALNPTTGPGGYAYQSRLLTDHIAVYERDHQLSGILVWDLRDFALTPTFAGGSIKSKVPGIRLLKGLNQKGLFDYSGRAKPAEAIIAKLFRELPAD